MNSCIPFYTENNSHNLPFYLLKDKNKNDVIYINKENIIYTNEKDIDMSRQILLYNCCLECGICYVYKINDNISIIKKVKYNDTYYYLCNNKNEFYIYYQDNRGDDEINIHSNGNYLCLTSNEYQDYIGDIVFGYDLSNNKLLDYNDPITCSNIYKYLIEVRRCRFDCIYSIIKGSCYVKDKNILYNFLSFILDYNVNGKNYHNAMIKARKIVLERYPNIDNVIINSVEDINNIYNINKFCFHRSCSKIKNLKYIK